MAKQAVKSPLDTRVCSCACPDCAAPMSVREWLNLADCWQCGLSIALDRVTVVSPPAAEQKPSPAAVKAPVESPKAPVKSPVKKILPPPPVTRPIPQPLRPAPIAAVATNAPDRLGFNPREMLAWLISAIVHLLLMILLGLLSFGEDSRRLELVLSVDLDEARIPSEYRNEHGALVVPDFDLPIPRKPRTQGETRALQIADEQARELRLEEDTLALSLPPIQRVQQAATSDDPYVRMLAARDPRVRAIVVRQEGGTTMTEAAVARGLRWIARHQNRDGSWSLHDFSSVRACRGHCDDEGSIRSDAGGTALALMAFLGAGQTHRTGIYRNRVAYGLQYLLSIQERDGDLRGRGSNQAGMYVHALAALVLCDAFKLTGDEALRRPAQLAIDFICESQHRRGGWRYEPNEAGDTSVVGWQLMALHSARAAFLKVPSEVLDSAAVFLDRAQADKLGATYSYQPGGGPTPAMTAEGLLSRMYLGWKKDHPGLQLGVDVLIEEFLPREVPNNIYYWYYATQVMHHWGGKAWIEWNRQMPDILITTQKRRGHEAGSWNPNTPHGHQGGRLYMTALACCTLEVYYRHAPLYRKIVLE